MLAFSRGLRPSLETSEQLVQDVVKWSFDKLPLNGAAQNMFLDCVTFMDQQPYGLAMRVWEAWWPHQAHTAFNRLLQLSLVSLHDDGKLVVLDVITLIGRSMLLQAASSATGPAAVYAGSRVWPGADGKLQGAVQVRISVRATGHSACHSHQG